MHRQRRISKWRVPWQWQPAALLTGAALLAEARLQLLLCNRLQMKRLQQQQLQRLLLRPSH
jgi:ABC-type uncharacterized transport system permease subunit